MWRASSSHCASVCGPNVVLICRMAATAASKVE
ncbi:Uncharacterised protein [Bordetella pertussis]|nr:Uncharacterised protein [Bordetella pertussis]